MKLPEVQERLDAVIAKLNSSPHQTTKALVDELLLCRDAISRRPAVRRAPNTSTKMTPELHEELRVAAEQNPDMPFSDIGYVYGVNGARVSEAVAGRRT